MTNLTLEEIKESLCVYDTRNPDCIILDDEEMKERSRKLCYCDNCHYGKHRLANDFLLLIEGRL